MTAREAEVLIVGAGPTGLTLALWLRRLGVAVRIVDKRSSAGETSRALAVQARTLEFHRQIGVIDDVLEAGVRIDRLTVRTPAGVVTSLPLDRFGAGITAYPFAFALPQDIHERILINHLARAGVRIERNVELVSFEEIGGGVTAKLRSGGITEFARVGYICGADGAHSVVRHQLGIGFPGGSYDQSFYVADVDGTGEVTQDGMDVTVSNYGFALVMPVRQSGSMRLTGVVPKEHEPRKDITFQMIRAEVERDTGIKVNAVNWFSTYRVHHRVADRFRVGRAFIVGDAGHIHSPAGGQGMNTGMGDAVNLAWKLAAVLQGRAREELLDTYEPERIAFARLLIEGTDKAFKLMTTRNRLVGLVRQYLMPHLLARLLNTRIGSRMFFERISQTRINYRHSALSSGKAGEIRAGDRLPYVQTDGGDNFVSLASLDWQTHVYGEAADCLLPSSMRTGVPLHVFALSKAAEAAGLSNGTACLVRPDGHVALVAENADAIEAFVERWGIVARRAPSATTRRDATDTNIFIGDRAELLRGQQRARALQGAGK